MSRESLSSVCSHPQNERLRDEFEGEFADSLDLDPDEYIVWLEDSVLAKGMNRVEMAVPLTNDQLQQVEDFLKDRICRGVGGLDRAIRHAYYLHGDGK